MSLWESKLLDSLTFCVLILKLAVPYTGGLIYCFACLCSIKAEMLTVCRRLQPLLSTSVPGYLADNTGVGADSGGV